MQENRAQELRSYLKNEFEGVNLIDEEFEVCAAEVCHEFGGCSKCKGNMVTRETNDKGEKVGPTRLFTCTHWCHVDCPQQ